MPTFEDPVTGTDYDLFDPSGLAMTMISVVGGLTMTLLALSIANENVLPWLQSTLAGLVGRDVGGGDDGGLQLGG